MRNNSRQFNILLQEYNQLRNRLPNKIAITAVNFFKRNFKVGGFVDKPFQKWKKSQMNKRTTMVQSGNLRRAIKKLRVSRNRVVVGIGQHIPYAQIHNEGGQIPITPKMRRFFWAKFKETGKEHWKNMALTKKKHLEIPQRKFIGDTKALEITIERMMIKELKTLIK